MSVPRTLLASLAIVAAGVATLAVATDGLRAFTAETARRIDVREHPRAVPPIALQTARGELIDIAGMRGRWLLVDFIYTRCMTYCSVQGSEFARLQRRLARSIAEHRVALLSISFDPAYDGPVQLAAYQQRSGDRGAGWIAARPTSAAALAALMQVFGVTRIPDGFGGYVHNAAIAVVDPHGRLVAIMDWDTPDVAAEYVLGRLAQ
ncbi:MAG TPA: SCO family protein [Rhodanobacteraceae bacterium]|nr:SCO family protein [Rhodanobacteraceae bacterium]